MGLRLCGRRVAGLLRGAKYYTLSNHVAWILTAPTTGFVRSRLRKELLLGFLIRLCPLENGG